MFIDEAKAVSEAARAIGLLNQSDEAKVEAWFAMQAVADLVGPASNTGIRGISWSANKSGKAGVYNLQANCADGVASASLAAPATLDEARQPDRLRLAVAALDRACDKLGGRASLHQMSRGTGAALLEAVGQATDGAAWIESHPGAAQRLMTMVRVANAYGPDGVYAPAALAAHNAFITFHDRAKLIRAYPLVDSAQAKARWLNGRSDVNPDTVPKLSDSLVRKIAKRTGTRAAESRAVGRALMDGVTKRKLLRLVHEWDAEINPIGETAA